MSSYERRIIASPTTEKPPALRHAVRAPLWPARPATHSSRIGYTARMLMVVFGAGASYDSAPDFPLPQPQAAQANSGTPPAPPNAREFWRPPLTPRLFLDSNGEFGGS